MLPPGVLDIGVSGREPPADAAHDFEATAGGDGRGLPLPRRRAVLCLRTGGAALDGGAQLGEVLGRDLFGRSVAERGLDLALDEPRPSGAGRRAKVGQLLFGERLARVGEELFRGLRRLRRLAALRSLLGRVDRRLAATCA